MNPIEELNLVEQQIHTLNEAQALYPVKNEKITIQLMDTKLIRTYETSDAFLDVFLDSIIIHQSLLDDYKVRVTVNKPFTDTDEDEDSILVLDTYITRAGHDAMKKALDEDKTQLVKMIRRQDPRPVKRKEQPELPKWATLDENAKTLPSMLLLGPTAVEMEEFMQKGEEVPFKKLKVKNLPVQEGPIGHLEL